MDRDSRRMLMSAYVQVNSNGESIVITEINPLTEDLLKKIDPGILAQELIKSLCNGLLDLVFPAICSARNAFKKSIIPPKPIRDKISSLKKNLNFKLKYDHTLCGSLRRDCLISILAGLWVFQDSIESMCDSVKIRLDKMENKNFND